MSDRRQGVSGREVLLCLVGLTNILWVFFCSPPPFQSDTNDKFHFNPPLLLLFAKLREGKQKFREEDGVGNRKCFASRGGEEEPERTYSRPKKKEEREKNKFGKLTYVTVELG